MPIDERARHQLFQKLEARIGADEAATLMELLPPVGWADVATKRDLDAVAAAIRLEHEALADKLTAVFERGLKEQAHRIYAVMATTVTGAMIAVATLAFVAARLI